MRFLALVRKELRECLPWLLTAGLLLLAVGALALRAEAQYGQPNWLHHDRPAPGAPANVYRLTQRSALAMPTVWLAFTAPSLGLVLGVRHFWMPLVTRTWSFLLHRSASRTTILAAKCGAAILAFLLSVGAVWTGLYWYACRPEVFPVPAPAREFVNGWFYIAVGVVVYLGTALSALSAGRWYTTRMFGLAFAVVALFVILMQWHLVWAAVLLTLTLAILVSQMLATFLDREF